MKDGAQRERLAASRCDRGTGLLFLILTGCWRGANEFTGHWMADYRPTLVWYLALTQTESTVNGYLVEIVPDRLGNTKASTFPVHGNTDGAAITITTSALLNQGSVTLSGWMQGAELVLAVPAASGGVHTPRFKRASPDEFNAVLTV